MVPACRSASTSPWLGLARGHQRRNDNARLWCPVNAVGGTLSASALRRADGAGGRKHAFFFVRGPFILLDWYNIFVDANSGYPAGGAGCRTRAGGPPDPARGGRLRPPLLAVGAA